MSEPIAQTKQMKEESAPAPFSHKIPPGPRSHFLLGNVQEIQRDGVGFNMAMTARYGDVVRVRVLTWPTYMVFHPDDVKHVLQENHRNYNKDVYNVNLLKPLMGQGLFTNDGQSWLRQRRLAQPAFHRKRLATFGTLITNATEDMLERWQATGGQQPIEIGEEMMRLTLRIVGQALFSIDLSDEADTVGRAFSAIRKLLQSYVFRPFPPLGVPTPRNHRLNAAIRSLDGVVQGIINERRQHNADTGDLLSMLLLARDEETGEGMSDRQLRDEVNRPHYAHFPFGGGPRLCIGSNLAMMEAQLITATVAQRYQLKLVPGHRVEPEISLTLRPKYGLPMTIHER
jgi:cytochrome P450